MYSIKTEFQLNILCNSLLFTLASCSGCMDIYFPVKEQL